ncbi:uncharacterized protein LOC129581962 [Paramacrobiotus metropolitanus]|uniref:uncharacterized protein LOC129581962 n=1 Tax=Paramacrobiotus metropolitanus TaxID=2943436 RepID=UPI0024465010|nr:uncharacterized protein LOC129581962 [Paramacrobiotus metropolitanus]
MCSRPNGLLIAGLMVPERAEPFTQNHRKDKEWTRRLIGLVKKNVGLWKTDDPSYHELKNRAKRDDVWKSITARLGHPRSDHLAVREAWQNMRTYFMAKGSQGPDVREFTHWRHQLMSFLLPYTRAVACERPRVARKSVGGRRAHTPVHDSDQESAESDAEMDEPADGNDAPLPLVKSKITAPDVAAEPSSAGGAADTEQGDVVDFARQWMGETTALPPVNVDDEYAAFYNTVKGMMGFLTPEQRAVAQKLMVKALAEFSAEVM